MFAPGVGQLVKDFKITSTEMSSFVVSVYLLGYCFGPLLIAPLSEMYGRRIIYNVCNILYVIFTIACAVAPDISSLTVFRFFAGCAGSSPLTIGAGSMADMFVQEKRGSAMAAWALGPLIGPVIGPVGMLGTRSVSSKMKTDSKIAGGYLAQAKGWRWTFWVLAMAVSATRHHHDVWQDADPNPRAPLCPSAPCSPSANPTRRPSSPARRRNCKTKPATPIYAPPSTPGVHRKTYSSSRSFVPPKCSSCHQSSSSFPSTSP